jgi:Reverse transcriptase (RNA-dependent DNA polymerase)/zinc-binding in reverse transcriptase
MRLLQEYEEVQVQNEIFCQQRSRVRWAMLGDKNTGFFHNAATVRRRQNQILTLHRDDGSWTDTEHQTKGLLVRYFKELYKQSDVQDQSLISELNLTLRTVPPTMHPTLQRTPTTHEVLATLKQMGPDRAPGPDGLTARFLLSQWEILGDVVIGTIQQAFRDGIAPPSWILNHLVLIPKVDHPTKPSHFRTLSVCSVYYRLLSKLIANRIKLVLSSLISDTQATFLKGRSIQDSVLLMKEVLHSFQTEGYTEKAFAIKADLYKAFDTLNWSYLLTVLQSFNFPQVLIKLIISCVMGSKFSIKLNGAVSYGFFTPARGLRQGCPLSPYLFILSMEILSKMLEQAQVGGRLKGLTLAQQAPQLTHSLYADDLVLFGLAENQEVQEITKIMQKFGSMSGLFVNNEKSVVWFSKRVTAQLKGMVLRVIPAKEANDSTTYLGYPFPKGRVLCRHYNGLLGKYEKKFFGWKLHKLSHAGRMVLTKTVLEMLPIYSMGAQMLPKTVLKKMESLMKRFFWGKLQQNRYLAFTAWDKVCMERDKGGLGLRKLETLNEAIVLKAFWVLATSTHIIWVQINKAKYQIGCTLWTACASPANSVIQNNMIQARDKIIHKFTFKIGSGENILAVGAPWFLNWADISQATTPISIRVADLWDQESLSWKAPLLRDIFSHEGINAIMNISEKPTRGIPDLLVWTETNDGRYLVKSGYETMISLDPPATPIASHPFWSLIWEVKAMPRVQTFLWRVGSNALPVLRNLTTRINRVVPTCQLCGMEDETVHHMLFICTSARATWYISPLELRTPELPLDTKNALVYLLSSLSEGNQRLASYLLWEI